MKKEQQTRLQAGLDKLVDAATLVDELKDKAREKSIELSRKQLEADNALQNIQDSIERSSSQRQEVSALKETLSTEEAALNERKKAIDLEVAGVKPLLEQAQKAVSGIKSETLGEVRALRTPPVVVRDILQAVLMMMGIYDTTWQSMRSFLAKRGIKEDIISFDARRINAQTREQVEEHLSANAQVRLVESHCPSLGLCGFSACRFTGLSPSSTDLCSLVLAALVF